MWHRLLPLIAVLAAGIAFAVPPNAPSSTVPPATSVWFDPPITVTAKLSDNSVVEGRMSEFDVEGVHLTSLSGKRLFIEIKRVRTLRSQSGFHFNSDSDKVMSVIQQARTLQSAGQVAPPVSDNTEEPKSSDLDSTNWDSLVAAGIRESQIRANANPRRVSPDQPQPFRCSRCGCAIEGDGDQVTQFAFCPKCGAAQSDNAATSGSSATLTVSRDSQESAHDASDIPAGSKSDAPFLQTPLGHVLFVVLATAVFFIILKMLFGWR